MGKLSALHQHPEILDTVYPVNGKPELSGKILDNVIIVIPHSRILKLVILEEGSYHHVLTALNRKTGAAAYDSLRNA